MLNLPSTPQRGNIGYFQKSNYSSRVSNRSGKSSMRSYALEKNSQGNQIVDDFNSFMDDGSEVPLSNYQSDNGSISQISSIKNGRVRGQRRQVVNDFQSESSNNNESIR